MTQLVRTAGLMAALVVLLPGPARADGFITPYYGYNFGGDSGNCVSLTNCEVKRTNFGVSFGAMGKVFGFEEDIGYAKNFFGDTPGTDNSVFSAMSNLLVGIGTGPVQPYGLIGLGLIRPHVSFNSSLLPFDKNALGYDFGGGLNIYFGHVGVRGDLRHLHALQDISLLIFNGQKLDFWRFSVGLALRF